MIVIWTTHKCSSVSTTSITQTLSIIWSKNIWVTNKSVTMGQIFSTTHKLINRTWTNIWKIGLTPSEIDGITLHRFAERSMTSTSYSIPMMILPLVCIYWRKLHLLTRNVIDVVDPIALILMFFIQLIILL